MWIFLAAFAAGTLFGLGVAALCNAASAADDELERELAARLLEQYAQEAGE